MTSHGPRLVMNIIPLLRDHSLLQKYDKPEPVLLRQLQLTSWPTSDVLPPNKGHILDLMDLIHSWQQSNPIEGSKLLIHCM